MPSVLLIGGAGKISLLLTPLLLSRSWTLTSLIRSPAQEATIRAAAAHQPGKCTVLVRSLEDVKSDSQAREILDESGAECVIWSAGAGGKGGPSRTYAIDRDACCHFIRAATTSPRITTFLLISYIGSRRRRPAWWSDSDWASSQATNNGALKDYHSAKVAADECLTAAGRKQGAGFRAICLRPGTLTDGEGEGKVALGKTSARGEVNRKDVARVIVALLEGGYAGGWLDLLNGEEAVSDAVERCEKEAVNCVEGEDTEEMVRNS